MSKVLLKIIPELVPESSWSSNLRSLLSKQEWDMVRKEVYRKASWKCEVCGGKGKSHPIECHEMWNYDEARSIQKLVRLIGLCPACHEIAHIGLAEVRGRLNQAIRHMCKVNGIKKTEANQIINKAFDDWRRRSAMDWKLDVSLLVSLGVDLNKIKLGSKRRR